MRYEIELWIMRIEVWEVRSEIQVMCEPNISFLVLLVFSTKRPLDWGKSKFHPSNHLFVISRISILLCKPH